MPQALVLPSPAILEVANLKLQQQIRERQQAEAQLRQLNLELEQRVAQRTADLAAANQLQEELWRREKVARAEAETANRRKDEFLATLSHELRTPLNAILGWAALLRTRSLNPTTQDRALEAIERNARSQTQLIEDILDVSRIIRGQLNLALKKVDLAEVIQAAVDTVLPMARAKSLDLKVNLPATHHPISGDSVRLQQVIWNLLSNAIKFTPEQGRVTVELSFFVGDSALDLDLASELAVCRNGGQPLSAASTQLQGSEQNFAQIQVSDTGKGISAEFLPYVFDRFRQEDSSSTRSHGGLGLGLAIVRHVIELHGGTVLAESGGEGQGAQFTIRLPLEKGLVGPPGMRSPETGGRVSQETDPARGLAGLRVMLVEDERDVRELLVTVLRLHGAEVLAVESATAALELLSGSATLELDVLVSDISMPDEDGYSLIRQLRAIAPAPLRDLPAIALTAHVTDSDRQQALEAGYQVHLAKPITVEEFVAVVARLGGKSEPEALEAPLTQVETARQL